MHKRFQKHPAPRSAAQLGNRQSSQTKHPAPRSAAQLGNRQSSQTKHPAPRSAVHLYPFTHDFLCFVEITEHINLHPGSTVKYSFRWNSGGMIADAFLVEWYDNPNRRRLRLGALPDTEDLPDVLFSPSRPYATLHQTFQGTVTFVVPERTRYGQLFVSLSLVKAA